MLYSSSHLAQYKTKKRNIMSFYKKAEQFRAEMNGKINIVEIQVKPIACSTSDDLLNKINDIIDIDAGHTLFGMVVCYEEDNEAHYLGQFSDMSMLLATLTNKLICEQEANKEECMDYFYIVGFNGSLQSSDKVVLVTLDRKEEEKLKF